MNYIGIDIIEIARINQAIARWGERFLQRIYTERELNLYRGRPPSLAVRFACKEAVMKLLGTGSQGVAWREIETLSHPSGKPRLNLHGRARREAEKLGVREIEVSLSHCKEYAIASVIANAETDQQ